MKLDLGWFTIVFLRTEVLFQVFGIHTELAPVCMCTQRFQSVLCIGCQEKIMSLVFICVLLNQGTEVTKDIFISTLKMNFKNLSLDSCESDLSCCALSPN